MTKAELIRIFKTPKAVAIFLGIRTQAISQWQDDEPIPEKQELKLRLKRPDLFSEPSEWEKSVEALDGGGFPVVGKHGANTRAATTR